MTKSCDSKRNKKSSCKGSKCENENKNVSQSSQEQTKNCSRKWDFHTKKRSQMASF